MQNHIKLATELVSFASKLCSKELTISQIMKRINQIYAQYFNKTYNYIGHLFQDRYHSEVIETDQQLLSTSRYIHLNPVRKLVEILSKEFNITDFMIGEIGPSVGSHSGPGALAVFFINKS